MSKYTLLADYNILESDKEITLVSKSEDSLDKFANAVVKNNTVGKVYIILCESLFFSQSRTQFEGIQLLKWLRIKGVMNHCVMASFMPYEMMTKMGVDKLFLASGGLTFFQLENDWQQFKRAKSFSQEATSDEIKNYLRAGFNIIKFRHEYANVWGLKRLVSVNKIFSPTINISLKQSTGDSLDYNIAEFLYNKASGSLDAKIKSSIIRQLKKLQAYTNLHVLYIDDKADEGWLEFLQKLFKASVKFSSFKIKKEESDDLYGQFTTIHNGLPVDFIISDLRLYPSDEGKSDYNDFASIKLMKQILDAKEYGRLKYKNLRYMLFTASNQLMGFRMIINDKENVNKSKYAPDALFIKEGFDIQNTANQEFLNYLDLLYSLNTLAKQRYRKQGASIENYSEEESKKIDLFEDGLSITNNQPLINRLDSLLKPYTHIILDSNVLIGDNSAIALSDTKKIIITYPVHKELERIAELREFSLRNHLANYFTSGSFIISTDGLEKTDIETIDRKFLANSDLKDLADGYFKQILEYFKDISNSNVLFITDDITAKDGNPPPFTIVKDWIVNDNITNVTVKNSWDFIDKKFNAQTTNRAKY